MATVKVAMIGSGGMAKNHIGPLKGLADVAVVGFCDVVLERAQAMADEHGGAAFDDPGKMLEETGADCAYVLLPPFAHGAAEQACLERGVPFFIEKPINNNLEQAREIAAAVESQGLVTSVGYMNRYRQAIRQAKATLAEDPAVYLNGGWVGGKPNPSPDRPISMWWVDKSKSGGQFVEQVTHTVDIVRFLAGDVVEVAAFAAKGFNQGVPGYSIDDALAVSLKFASGAVCSLASCCAASARGGIWLDVYAGGHTFKFSGWDHKCEVIAQGQKPEVVEGEPDIFVVEDKIFTDAVRSGDASEILCRYPDGLKTLEVTLAANRAAETGSVVALPL